MMVINSVSSKTSDSHYPHHFHYHLYPHKSPNLHFSLSVSLSLSLPSQHPSPHCIHLREKMRKTHKIFFFNFLTLFIILQSIELPTVASSNSWAGSKYQVECTMCSACNDPCDSPAPPPPSPPPPSYASPPPPSTPSSPNCPPPPAPPSYSNYPPPPSHPTYSYPPPAGGGGGGGGGYYYPPAPYTNFPGPAPPNPILPYFPFYYYNPPPQPINESVHSVTCSVVSTIALFLVSLLCFF